MGCSASSSENSYILNRNLDLYHSLPEVSRAIRQAGLESSNLIFGIDFTGSNQVNV